MFNETLGRDRSAEPAYNGSSIQDNLIYLRDTFSDEIPTEIIHSAYKNNRYKVRKSWFVALAGDLEYLIDNDLIPSDLLSEVNGLHDDYRSVDFYNKFIPGEEIPRANSLINKLVAGVDSDPMLWRENPTYKINFV